MNCANPKCIYSAQSHPKSTPPTKQTLPPITCPDCLTAKYHSLNCMLQDQPRHSFECRRRSHPGPKPGSSTSKLSQSQRASNEKIIKNKYKYQISNQIGEGSYGYVYSGQSLFNTTNFAMKVVEKAKIDTDELKTSIANEIQIHSKLKHPHIIKMVDYSEDSQNIYMVLEMATGGNLYTYLLANKSFSEKESFVYFFQTLLAVDYLHYNGTLFLLTLSRDSAPRFETGKFVIWRSVQY